MNTAIISLPGGGLAQLEERIVRNDEAGGSSPLPSTTFIESHISFFELAKCPAGYPAEPT
jgi:hypothetical protein